jgi:hypothetical protein
MGRSKDIFDQASQSIRDHYEWQDAVYTPSAGSPVTCAVQFSLETIEDPNGFNAGAWVQRKTVTGLLEDFGKEPDAGETFLIDSTTYTVVTSVPENQGRFVKVIVK